MLLTTLDAYLITYHIFGSLDSLAKFTGFFDVRGGFEARRIAPQLVLMSSPLDGSWDRHRLFWRDQLVFDADVQGTWIGLRSFSQGRWVSNCLQLALAREMALRSPLNPLPPQRRGGRPRPGRPRFIGRTDYSRRRGPILALAAAIAAQGEPMEGDPSARARRIDGQFVAVTIVGPHVLLSVHAPNGHCILSATLDRTPPWHLRETIGACPATAGLLLAAAGGAGTDDEIAFRAFCERRPRFAAR